MINLQSVTLIAIDGVGNNNFITKAIQLSKNNINFFKCLLLSPNKFYENSQDIEIIQIDKMTYYEWNRFMIKEIYKYVNTSHYLFIDSDGFVINGNLWNDEFLKYDYIGAPWIYSLHIFTNVVDEKIKQRPREQINLVGNGGFTLRSKKLANEMLNCLDDRFQPEDVYICQNNYDYFISKDIKFAPITIANIFAQDPLLNLSSTFGFHGNKEYIKTI